MPNAPVMPDLPSSSTMRTERPPREAMRARADAIVVLPTPPLPATIRTRLCAQKVPTSMWGRA